MYKVRMRRVPFARDVRINGEIMVRAIDISEGGLYVHTGRYDNPGKIVDLEIPHEGVYIKVKARVSHSQEAIGMGLMFVNPDFEAKKTIRLLIDSLEETNERESAEGVKNKAERGVLLVDDNLTTQRIYKSKLVLEGFIVLTANDGLEAVKMLKSRHSEIDVIVLDLFMEKLDGFKVLSIIKDATELRDIPVVVISAKHSPETMKKALDHGADQYLAKVNTSPSKLAQALRELLESQAAETGKVNCWNFQGESAPSDECRKCRAFSEARLNGIHGGRNGGRSCWAVMTEKCRGTLRDTPAAKYENCLNCGFYKSVKREEGKDFQDTLALLYSLGK